MRVITSSNGALSVVKASLPESDADRLAQVRVLSCVFRAGRAGAETDHSSVLYDVDQAPGRVKQGTINAHWYKLGLLRDLFSTGLLHSTLIIPTPRRQRFYLGIAVFLRIQTLFISLELK